MELHLLAGEIWPFNWQLSALCPCPPATGSEALAENKPYMLTHPCLVLQGPAGQPSRRQNLIKDPLPGPQPVHESSQDQWGIRTPRERRPAQAPGRRSCPRCHSCWAGQSQPPFLQSQRAPAPCACVALKLSSAVASAQPDSWTYIKKPPGS